MWWLTRILRSISRSMVARLMQRSAGTTMALTFRRRQTLLLRLLLVCLYLSHRQSLRLLVVEIAPSSTPVLLVVTERLGTLGYIMCSVIIKIHCFR